MRRIAKPAARVFAGVFLIVAALPLVDNGLIGLHGFFESGIAVDCVHFLFALMLIAASMGGETRAATGLYYVAGFCAVFAFAGYWQADRYGHSLLYGLARVNSADNALHAVFAAALAVSGAMNTAKQQVIRE